MADSFQLKAILSAVDKLTPTLKVVQAQAQVAKKYIGDLGGSINGLASKFGVGAGIFAGIAAGFGLAAIKKAVVGYAELGEEVIKGAAKAGLSTDEYQRFKYVAEQAGVQADVFAMSMGKLEKNLGAAGMGQNKGLVDLMRLLKIPLKDVNGQVREGVDVLPQLAEAIKLNEGGVKRAAVGNAFLGRSYQELLPLLAEGSEGIVRSLARFKTLKGIIPREDLEGAKQFGDKLQDVAFVTKGFQMTIARELVPVLSPMVEQFVQWAAANKKLIGTEVKKIVQDIVVAVRSVDWGAFLQGVQNTVRGIGQFVDMVGGLRNVLIGLVLYMNASTIASVVGLAGAFLRLGLAAGGALVGMAGSIAPFLVAAAPFLLAAAAIAGAAYLVYRNWDVVGPALGRVWEGIKTTATVAWNVLRFLWSWTPLGIVVNNWGAILGWLGGFWDSLKAVVVAGLALVDGALASWGVYDTIRAVWDPIVEFFRGVWDNIGGIVSRIASVAGSVAGAVGGFFTDRFGAGASQQAFGPRFDGPTGPLLAQTQPLALGGPQAQVGGAVTVSFKDAPPGMRVEQTKSDNARVPVRTDVGYRYTAALGY